MLTSFDTPSYFDSKLNFPSFSPTEYSRTVFILLSAWLIGYFNFSATWLMVGLFVFMWRQQRRIHATFKDQIQQRAALMDERSAISR